MRQEVVICGFTEPRGSRKQFGALVLGVYEDGQLLYVGHTSTGFDDNSLRSTYELLKKFVQKNSPFGNIPKTNTPVTWVKPVLVGEVEFSEWTGDGHMRHPIFKGLREDKNPKEVHREQKLDINAVLDLAKSSNTARNKVRSSKSKKGSNHKSGLILIQEEQGSSELKLSNLDKIYWPKEKYTKGDLIKYYQDIAPFILPYLKGRPQSLNRHPDGIEGENFFQKNFDYELPGFVQTVDIRLESENRTIKSVVCQNIETLLYLVNLGCIEINPWNSRIQNLDKPDYLILDLDTEDISFNYVIETAKVAHKILDGAGIESYCKTSGKTGLHIYIPLGAKYTNEQARKFAEIIARLVNKEYPKYTSVARSPKQRQKKVYVDYLQNRHGQTLASAYSVRPWPGATVSMPLKWSEVKKGLDPSKFTIKNMFKRMQKTGDIWQPVLGPGVDLEQALKKMDSEF